MPQETQTLPSEQGPDIEMIDDSPPKSSQSMVNGGVDLGVHVSLGPDFIQVPSTSFSRGNSRLLHFHISYGDQIIPIQISDSDTVGEFISF